MNKSELQKEWVRALRSGEYQQGKETLHEGDKFCCLGVLCEVLVREKIVERKRHQEYYYETEDGNGRMDTELCPPVLSLVGLTGEQHGTLIRMNDGVKEFADNPQPFSAIADYIEKEVMKHDS